MELSREQKRSLYERGFVHLPGVVPDVMVRAALRAINHSLGEGMDRDAMQTMRSQSFCPELRSEPVITDLINRTPLLDLAESAIGRGCLEPVRDGQIALRFPALTDPAQAAIPHLDGMHSPHNGVPEGKILNFTMLAGVFLSDVMEQYAGNFTVWPGTHRLYERYFRQHGARALLEGMPPIDLPVPAPILARTGDAILCHYELGHTAGPNVSPHVRYAVFYRLERVEHEARMDETMTDIWLEWDGMREFTSTTSA